jgi:hypothetical protein
MPTRAPAATSPATPDAVPESSPVDSAATPAAEAPAADTATAVAADVADTASSGAAGDGPAGEGPATEHTATGEAPAEPRRRGRPKGSAARTTRTIELILTVSGTADGEWQAELKQGATWLSRGLPVSAAAVSRAAAELHAEIAGPIDQVIGAAREQRAARVAALEAELEQARKALAEMDEPPA